MGGLRHPRGVDQEAVGDVHRGGRSGAEQPCPDLQPRHRQAVAAQQRLVGRRFSAGNGKTQARVTDRAGDIDVIADRRAGSGERLTARNVTNRGQPHARGTAPLRGIASEERDAEFWKHALETGRKALDPLPILRRPEG